MRPVGRLVTLKALPFDFVKVNFAKSLLVLLVCLLGSGGSSRVKPLENKI